MKHYNGTLTAFTAQIRASERKKVTSEIVQTLTRALQRLSGGEVRAKTVKRGTKRHYKRTCGDCGAKVKGLGVHRAMKHEGKGRWNKKT